MDEIDAVLTQLETKRESLHEAAQQLLVDLRAQRGGAGPDAGEGERDAAS